MEERGALGMAFLVNSPFLRRILWHGKRIATQPMDGTLQPLRLQRAMAAPA